MTATTAKRPKPRPLSPHLQIYRPQLTSTLSILHRMTGVALSLGLPLFVAWLVVIAMGAETYTKFQAWLGSPLVLVFLAGWSFCFFYHLANGVRHLLWDAGFFLALDKVYATGRIVIGVSVLLTLGAWAMIGRTLGWF